MGRWRRAGAFALVVGLTAGGSWAWVDVRSEARRARDLAVRLQAAAKRHDVRAACEAVQRLKEDLSVRAETPGEQPAAERELDDDLRVALDLAEGEPQAKRALSAFGASLREFLAADHAGDGPERESALADARERLQGVRAVCSSMSFVFEWDLPKVGRGRPYPATAPGTRLMESVDCDWWGSSATASAPYCVYGTGGPHRYSLTGRVETWEGSAIANAKIAYHVQGLRRPVVTWSNAGGDYAFYGIPTLEDKRVTCAWRVTKAEGFGAEIFAEYIYASAFGGSIYLDEDRVVSYEGDIHPPWECRHWIPRAFRGRWDVSPVEKDF